jgi:hypothetical protein
VSDDPENVLIYLILHICSFTYLYMNLLSFGLLNNTISIKDELERTLRVKRNGNGGVWGDEGGNTNDPKPELCSYNRGNTTWMWRVKETRKRKFIHVQAVEALRVGEVEAPTFSGIRLIEGSKVVSPTRRPLFTSRKIPGTHFC